jgi:5-formyltetrahydrofolate cyclo-ligase
MPPSHDHDAGGDPDLLARKAELRDETWTALEEAGADRFPGAQGRIPNFVGAEAAADRLRTTNAWADASSVKANPDSPQWPVRQRAVEAGMRVYMAVPRLADERPFLLLDPGELEVSARSATSIKGASRHARPVPLGGVEPVDLVIVGSVAVSSDGARLGKGGGFSDLEFAIAREAGLVGRDTRVVTTVHPVQVVETGRIPMGRHDVPLDLIVTPEEVVVPDTGMGRPPGILWNQLTAERIDAIPLLQTLQQDRGAG